jgi:predicted lipoprotein with Yx(FWY)xxD motif
MKYVALPEVLLVLFFLLVACGFFGYAAATQPPWKPGGPIALEIVVSPTTAPAAVALASPVVTAQAGIPLTGQAIVQVATVGDFGLALVDGTGYSLYLYTRGEQYHMPNPCTGDECLEDWRPFLANGEPAAGQGADPNLLGTITWDDGSTQVTYNGWPLYLLPSSDQTPGDATGQADDHEWFLVSPSGQAIMSSGVE